MTRGDLTDTEWELIKPHLPLGAFGPIPDLRSYFNAIMWRFPSLSGWRETPRRTVMEHPDATAVQATVAHPDHLTLLEDLKAAVAGRFPRRESGAAFWDLVGGLQMGLPRKNCWSIAEAVGHRSPDRLQHLPSV